MSVMLLASLCLNLLPVLDDKPLDPADPKGRCPRIDKNNGSAAHVWHDDKGWHLRFRGQDKATVQFAGKVVTDTERPQFSGGQGEKKGGAGTKDRVSKITNGFGFNYKTSGYNYDAIDFTVPKACTRVTFEIKVGGNDDPKKILIGAKGEHPKTSTFTLPAHPDKK